MNAELAFFRELRDLGRATAKDWLAANYDAIGHSATLDLKAAYS
jgi:NTE family protein